jgi:hypothetical protein
MHELPIAHKRYAVPQSASLLWMRCTLRLMDDPTVVGLIGLMLSSYVIRSLRRVLVSAFVLCRGLFEFRATCCEQ